MRTEPSSILTGKFTVSSRLGYASNSRMPRFSGSWSAAMLNCRNAICQGSSLGVITAACAVIDFPPYGNLAYVASSRTAVVVLSPSTLPLAPRARGRVEAYGLFHQGRHRHQLDIVAVEFHQHLFQHARRQPRGVADGDDVLPFQRQDDEPLDLHPDGIRLVLIVQEDGPRRSADLHLHGESHAD